MIEKITAKEWEELYMNIKLNLFKFIPKCNSNDYASLMRVSVEFRCYDDFQISLAQINSGLKVMLIG